MMRLAAVGPVVLGVGVVIFVLLRVWDDSVVRGR
jgi:hypothetical protein